MPTVFTEKETQNRISSVRQRTDDILDILPDDDIQKVLDYAVKLTDTTNNPFRPLSREEIIHELDISEQQIKEGKYKLADEVTKSLKEKYDV